jgi:hypothetical protein
VQRVLNTPHSYPIVRQLALEFGIRKDSVQRIYDGKLYRLLKQHLQTLPLAA